MSLFAPMLRLARRPVIVLVWIWFIGIATGVGGLLDALGSWAVVQQVSPVDHVSDVMWLGLWRSLILVPAFSGLLAGILALEALQGYYAWTLPSLQRSLLASVVAAAVVTSLPLALVLAWVAAPAAAVAAFALGVFGFSAAASVAPGMVQRRHATWLIMSPVVALTIGAEQVAATAMARPALVSLAALGAAALVFARQYAPRALRGRVGLWSGPAWSMRRDDGSGRPRAERRWRRALHPGRLLDWLAAGEYEGFGRLRFGWPQWAATMGFVWVVLFGTASLAAPGGEVNVVFLPLLSGVWTPAFLRKEALYPMSRERRAVTTYWMSVAVTLATGTLAAATTLGWQKLTATMAHLPPERIAFPMRLLPFLMMWFPVALWVPVRYGPLNAPSPAAVVRVLRMVAVSLVCVGLSTTTMRAFATRATQANGAARFAIAVGIAAAIQVVYWLALRRFFARGDLRSL